VLEDDGWSATYSSEGGGQRQLSVRSILVAESAGEGSEAAAEGSVRGGSWEEGELVCLYIRRAWGGQIALHRRLVACPCCRKPGPNLTLICSKTDASAGRGPYVGVYWASFSATEDLGGQVTSGCGGPLEMA
jgi:uncharacterized protein YbaR (Trm112 family)